MYLVTMHITVRTETSYRSVATEEKYSGSHSKLLPVIYIEDD